jgi:pentatricopeptide repeat protein
MDSPANDATALLAVARERRREVLGATPLPQGLSHFTEYAGLISRALELGALLATEGRDLKAIAAHHDVEIRRIEAAFREIEAGMLADFTRDAALRERTFAVIDALVAAGQYEVALKMYERMHDGFTRGALETIIDHRNRIASESTVRIRLK